MQLILLTLALLAKVSAFHNASNCTEEFHTVLEKAAEIKSHCDIRGFYDCCEVCLYSTHTKEASIYRKPPFLLKRIYNGAWG